MPASIDHNAAEAVRHFARHARGAVLRDDGRVLLTAAATRFPGALHNTVMRCDATEPARSVLASARAFGAEHDRDLVLWASAHADDDLDRAARATGLRQRPGVLGMAIDRPPARQAAPTGTELTVVGDEDGVEGFAAVHRGLFGDDGPVRHFASPGALLAPNATAVVARRGGHPVACALVIASGTTAGVYWVATARDARGQGLGTAVTAAAVDAGFRHGAQVVVLQATEQGAAVYRALGFTAHTTYRRYLVEAG